MAKELGMLSKSLQENLDLTAYSQVGHTHNYAGSSTAGGAANTAVKLHTARTINGTSFDGSGNITTTNWGTARNITIGNSSKSVNGSGNVSWTLAEIGAADTAHIHTSMQQESLASKTMSLNDLNLSAGTTHIKYYYCPTDGGGSNITGRPNDSSKQAFNLKVELIRWASTTDYITKQTYIQGSTKQMHVRYCTNGTWSAWEKVYTSVQKPTYSEVGAAAASHGTHVTYATAAPSANGTAAVGSSAKVAREDHVHPLQTTISGAAGSAGKWTTARTLTIGNSGKSVDGSANVSWSLSEIGALPTAGGTMTGNIKFTDVTSTTYPAKSAMLTWNGSTDGADIYYQVDASDKGRLVLNTRDDSDCIIMFANNGTSKATIDNSGNFSGKAAKAGDADTATKLATGRSITIGNQAQTFDGSGNISFSVASIGASESGHTHNYAGSSSAGGAANSVKTNLIIKLNNGGTEGTNLFTFNGSTAKTVNITPNAIGAAASSHGTHVTYSTSAPLVAGTAAVGSANNVARGDHVHPAQTSVSGNAGTATKLATARTIQIGNKSNTFDGSANITYTLADIGAAATSHTHNQINSRGKVTCESGVTGRPAVAGLSMSEAYNNSYPTAYGNVISLKGTGDGQILVGWSGTDGAHAPVYVRSKRDNTSTANWSEWAQFYTTANKPTYSDVGAAAASHGTHVTWSTTAPKVAGTAAVGSETKVARGDHVHAAQTSVSGNAGTATKLQTARTITIGNKSNSFDGSANISYTLADIGAATSGHTHNYAGSSSAGGAANSAVKLSSARTINGTSFDGSANITTANWGTARKINQISVNGSADVKLPLDYYTCNIGNSNTKPYHHILATGQCAGDYTDKSITIVLVNHYNSAGLGIAKATLRTNQASAGSGATGELRWLVRSGFAENQLCFNIRNTAKDTYMDVFYKSTGTYNSLTWYVLTEGARGSHGSQWTKYNTHHDNGTNVYDETGMKAIRTYTATLQSAADHGAVNSAKTAAACSGNAATATTLQTARSIALGGLLSGSASFNGSANITINASVAKPPKSGDWFSGGIPIVNTDGVMEVGKYIDFHNTDASTNDYDVRLQANTSTPCIITLPSGGGTLARTSDSITGNAATATKLATARTLTIGSTGKTFDGSGNVSWTLAEIGAAASSHSHDSIFYQDTRSVNTAAKDVPAGLSVHLKSNGSDGISDGGSYHPVLMMKPWNDKSGWPVGQLAVTQNNNLYFRVSSGADDTSWNAWKKVSLDGHTHSAGGTVTAVNSNLSSVTINSYDSIMSSINTNIGKL